MTPLLPLLRLAPLAAEADELPPLPDGAAFLLAGLAACLWLWLRIGIVRGREARRGPEDPPIPTWGWLRALAAAAWIGPALLLVALGLAAGVAFVFLG